MANQSPLISVIIPCYNYGRFLSEAAHSALRQQKDGLAVEVIVVDDGSTDDTPAVARGLGSSICYIHQKNQGLSAARNTGMRAARGDFLVFLDADDLLTANTLSSHLDNFAAHPDTDASVCLSLQVFERREGTANYLWPLKCAHLDMHLCHSNISPVHTFMLRARAAREAGFFDPGLKACEDQDYWLRCAAAGKRFRSNTAGMVIYRQHGQSMTSQMPRQLAHDGALRFKISMLLESRPDFPRAGKFYGWLAHAAGTIGSACNLLQTTPRFALKLLEESARAMLRAAALTASSDTEDPHLLLAGRYFAAQYFLLARNVSASVSCPSLEKATGFLARRYPQFVQSNGLATEQKRLFHKLCCEYEQMQATVRKAFLE
ncbi:glycosyltransferase family 2 protein [Desulfovibrio sp. SGI.169]|uniref:glycosyltransferase family 2 protein n=1 Tax=Desulfovibrio sp. SGI.169 TaxID=3420561 RepID=UPI003CFC1191